MRRRSILIFAALAAPAPVASALAGSPYEDGTRTEHRREVVPPSHGQGPAGLFNCSFKEQRTKLERKNCGGTRS